MRAQRKTEEMFFDGMNGIYRMLDFNLLDPVHPVKTQLSSLLLSSAPAYALCGESCFLSFSVSLCLCQ